MSSSSPAQKEHSRASTVPVLRMSLHRTRSPNSSVPSEKERNCKFFLPKLNNERRAQWRDGNTVTRTTISGAQPVSYKVSEKYISFRIFTRINSYRRRKTKNTISPTACHRSAPSRALPKQSSAGRKFAARRSRKNKSKDRNF